MPGEDDMTHGLLALANTEAATREGRLRLVQSLGATLGALVSSLSMAEQPAPVTAGVADALAGVADSLARAAEHAAHLATHARVIAPPRRPQA